jgi:iron complex transport system substrate-binding protein
LVHRWSLVSKKIEPASISKPADTAKAKVLFIYARGQGTLMVAGQQMEADTLFSLSGGLNAIQGCTV